MNLFTLAARDWACFFLGAALVGGCIDGHAQTVVGLHTFSIHADDGKSADGSFGWNNQNFGAYIKHDGWTGGVFKNSLYRWSWYAGYTWDLKIDHALVDEVSLTLGVATGYDKVVASGGSRRAIRCSDICREVELKDVLAPLIFPSARKGIFRVGVSKAPDAPAFVHLIIEKEIE